MSGPARRGWPTSLGHLQDLSQEICQSESQASEQLTRYFYAKKALGISSGWQAICQISCFSNGVMRDRKGHRIIGWKRPLRSSPAVTTAPPCLLSRVPKCHIYTFLEHLRSDIVLHCPVHFRCRHALSSCLHFPLSVSSVLGEKIAVCWIAALPHAQERVLEGRLAASQTLETVEVPRKGHVCAQCSSSRSLLLLRPG